MEYNGKDVDEAVRVACESLGVSREQLDIEVKATGSSGIFGLCKKKATVLVSLKSDKETARANISPSAEIVSVVQKEEQVAATIPSPPAEKTANGGVDQRRAQRREPAEPLEVETIATIQGDLQQLLELMGCPSTLTVSQDEENKLEFCINGPHVDTVVGTEGQTLDSLQYLMRKIVSKKFPGKIMLSLDAGDFRATRMKELEERALALAREVKETKKSRAIPAMNPAERRIVHMALQNDSEIRSRSVGDGIFKKVLIYLPGKGKKRPPKKRKNDSD